MEKANGKAYNMVYVMLDTKQGEKDLARQRNQG